MTKDILRYYTGVGSRKAPPQILELMIQIAEHLAKRRWILRSGGADGSDKAFEAGHINIVGRDWMEIFYASDADVYPDCYEIAKQFHPAWDRCSDYAKKLHARNALQVLGPKLNHISASNLVICWTPDGCKTHKERTIKTGGTGTAISIADHNNIPVFNLQRREDKERITNKLKLTS